MRFAATLLAIFFIAAAPVAPDGAAARAARLDQLLATVRKASGEPYRYHIVSHARELVENRMLDITSESEGIRYRSRRCAGALCSGVYFDGERGYATNLNDSPLPTGAGADALQITLRTLLSYEFADPNFRLTGGRVVERPPVPLGDRTARRIAFVPTGGIAIEAVFDPSTSLLESAATPDGKFRFTFRQYRDVEGKITIPMQIDLNGKPFERFDRCEIVTERLAASTGLVPQIEGPAATIALRRSDPFGDIPILECTIGTFAVPCVLDTGNSGMSMSLELAEKLGIEPVGTAFEISGIGTYVTGVAKGPPLSIGRGVTYPAAYYVLLHDIHAYGFDLILGTDVFAATRLTLDYPKREVTFAPANGAATEHTLGLEFQNFVPVVSVGLNAEPISMLLDTGDQSTINLASTYYEAHPAVFKPTAKVNVSGIGGASEQAIGEIPSVTFGDFVLTRQRIGATKKPFPVGQGHVGSGFLSHFSVLFDYAHARVGLAPRTVDAAVTIKP